MAHLPEANPNVLVKCPYDKVHMVTQMRLPYHIMKCRRNYTGNDYETCPFNARHHMPSPELRYHIANCPDKAVVEKDILANHPNKEGVNFKGNNEVPPYEEKYTYQVSEDWMPDLPPCTHQFGESIDPRHYNNPTILKVLAKNPIVGHIAAYGKPKSPVVPATQNNPLPKGKPEALTRARKKPEHDISKDANTAILKALSRGRGAVSTPGSSCPPSPKSGLISLGRGRGKGAAIASDNLPLLGSIQTTPMTTPRSQRDRPVVSGIGRGVNLQKIVHGAP